jgi:hypothetical protein
MQINSTPTLAKSEPFTTGNADLDALMATWHSQAIEMDAAQRSGHQEPDFDSPDLPSYIQWQY